MGVAADQWLEALDVCRSLGRASLSLARLYEGHLNGVQLVELYGDDGLRERFAADIRDGALSAIWNTERPGHSLELVPDEGRVQLRGGKVFCSGAATATRPVICGTLVQDEGDEPGGWQMTVVPMDDTPHTLLPPEGEPMGVRGAGTRSILFEPTASIEQGSLVGAPGDYLREPILTAGAARFLAAQVGACERLVELVRQELQAAKRTDHHGQRTRAATLTRLTTRGRLWLDGFGPRCERWLDDPSQVDRLVAYTRAARTEIEELSHEVIQLASQCIGLRGLVTPHLLERLIRDLSTYLRQPALDTSVEGVARFTLDETDGLFAQELLDPDVTAPGPNRRLRGTPFADPASIAERPADWVRTLGRTAVIAPHPDDESLGAGGTIALLRDVGLPVTVLFLTDGDGSHPGSRSHPPAVLAELRREEARTACERLGVDSDAIHFLGLPDGAVPRRGADGFEEAVERLRTVLSDLPDGPPHTLLLPWRREPHGDHRAAYDLATASGGGARLVEYCVHLWKTRRDADLPRRDGSAAEVVPIRLDVSTVWDRKRAAIASHASQMDPHVISDAPAGFTMPAEWREQCERPGGLQTEILLLPPDGRAADTVPTAYFDAKYETAVDPWDFAGSPYEAAKYEATLDALPKTRFRRGLELGCSIGVLTARLAERCEALLAVDAASAAVARCRTRCEELDHVDVRTAVLPRDWPDGTFDLIIASEVLYYLSNGDLDETRAAILRSLEPGGRLVLVHWTVFVPDYPRTGDDVHDAFQETPGLRRLKSKREPFYRIDLFEKAD
ncbi:Mycothiol S-conjugate amidase [Planctomycetes bacterium LzC2]|uniref:Mycothiol S-conjugate amidase n=1 Tax=Alienimonas chondri TaxID=2681879 RepID=A0ABX1V809_9PLAN|nr:Mycothiol S-conjugate amidase [Alienimonas chondri]